MKIYIIYNHNEGFQFECNLIKKYIQSFDQINYHQVESIKVSGHRGQPKGLLMYSKWMVFKQNFGG